MQSTIVRITQENSEAIVREISKLEVVNYDTVSKLLPPVLANGTLTLNTSVYVPKDPTTMLDKGIGRYLVYDNADGAYPFSIWMFAFASGQKTAIHDHKYKGTVIILEGSILETYYRPTEANSVKIIRCMDRFKFHSTRDDLNGIFVHQLQRKMDSGAGVSVTLHIYNMRAHRISQEGEKIDRRNLNKIYS